MPDPHSPPTPHAARHDLELGLVIALAGSLITSVAYAASQEATQPTWRFVVIAALNLGSFAAARWAEKRRRALLRSMAWAYAVHLAAFALSLPVSSAEERMWAPIAVVFGLVFWFPAVLCATLGARVSVGSHGEEKG